MYGTYKAHKYINVNILIGIDWYKRPEKTKEILAKWFNFTVATNYA